MHICARFHIPWGIFCEMGAAMMENRIVVCGGRPLAGTVRVPVAKNSVLPLFAASLLCRDEVRLLGVPRLLDVEHSLELLRGVGCTARWEGDTAVLCGPVHSSTLSEQTAAQMRASILFCAPLLARLGRAETSLPGGCRIGARPIDLHLSGLAQMGVAELEAGPGKLVLTAPSGLHGAAITLGFPSVGATETLMLAAVCARGQTVLRGAAREPEIADLAAFLNRCGGCVEGAGSSVIRIEGRRSLGGCRFRPAADRIFASTLACAAAAAGGRVEVAGCAPALYAPVLEILEQMGCGVETAGDTVRVSRFGPLYGVGRVFTGAYPALATDAAPPLAAAMLCARSESSIEDVIFERRFGCAEGFCRLGARAAVQGRVLTVRPGGVLRGAAVEAPDLRGGAALVLAALAAPGTSVITHAEHISRGYAGFAPLLAALGARIRQESGAETPSTKKTSAKKQICLAIGAKR